MDNKWILVKLAFIWRKHSALSVMPIHHIDSWNQTIWILCSGPKLDDNSTLEERFDEKYKN